MIVLKKLPIYFLLFFYHAFSLTENEIQFLYKIYPLPGFKTVVDTCIRSYSDVLLLQDFITNGQRYDDVLDTLVGRLARLESYIDQLIYSYKKEATVTYDELEYLFRMIEYLEVTIAEREHETMSEGLNKITQKLKQQLKQVVISISFIANPAQQFLGWYRPSIIHYFQLT